ncbi:MAG: peptide chain release factor-like protein, partial [bacterium]|nr:peptide chain release factor-like protein [bacterium]
VSSLKWNSLNARLAELGIDASEISESFVRGSGKGGQKQNKSSSAVVLQYADVTIKCGESRYRELNRYKARVRLCDVVDSKINGTQSLRAKAEDKIRKQKSRRKRRAKET